MNAIAAKTDADLASADEDRLISLNDWAVNSLRDLADAGTITTQLASLVAAETPRVVEAGSCLAYLKARRVGACYRLNRKARRYIYVVVRTRQALAA